VSKFRRGCQIADWRMVGKSNGGSMTLNSACAYAMRSSRFGGATKGLLVSTSNWLSVRSLTLGRILSGSRGAPLTVGVPGLAAHASLNVDLLLVSDGPIFENGREPWPGAGGMPRLWACPEVTIYNDALGSYVAPRSSVSQLLPPTDASAVTSP
jgi:hypothetical protein